MNRHDSKIGSGDEAYLESSYADGLAQNAADVATIPLKGKAGQGFPDSSVRSISATSQTEGVGLTSQLQLAALGINKAYRKGEHRVSVLRGVDITLQKGEFLSIIGQSGSGKSTLLHLMGLLDVPDLGEVLLDGQRIDDLPVRTRDQIRNRVFGFVFQFYHLMPELTLLENVLMPLMIRYSTWEYWKNRRSFIERAKSLIHRVGLSHRLTHKPSELSGGEMQRAAIARSLISQPQILLADEPTGNLDEATGREIMDLLNRLNIEEQLSIVMVTHDASLAREATRTVRLATGKVEILAGAA